MGKVETLNSTKCFHCGDSLPGVAISYDAKEFCCVGCKSVYELLATNNLCDYYNLDENPGLSLKNPVSKVKFNFLDDEQIQKQLIQYRDEKISRITFHMPTMHCSSCIWLLESLYKLEKGVANSRVDFLKKQVSITFHHEVCSLRKLVELLSALGYEPSLNLNDLEGKKKQTNNRKLLYQVGVAGFGFGNIMLISFPEYFGLDSFSSTYFSKLFGFLNMALALPVFLYSAQDYFISAYKSLRKGIINIDFPLALGILVMFSRSSYEVISHTGIGFFDTLAGLVFFLLIGKWVQQRTIDSLSFERDYKSYFPVAVSLINTNEETTLPVNKLKIGDRILIRNNEIIPADSILLKGEAHVDFSFVTGENDPINKILGEIIYAGGRQIGGTIELEVCKTVSQSYLTQLWNSEHFSKGSESTIQSFQTVVSKYFTFVLLALAIGSALFWYWFDPSKSMIAFTSVLIIACPCALALSSPFALGNSMRMLGRSKFYIKSPEVVERMAKINHLVFDKTGTITQAAESEIAFHGKALDENQIHLIHTLCSNSVHPLSRRIVSYLALDHTEKMVINSYSEINGKGLSGIIGDTSIKIGSSSFVNCLSKDAEGEILSTRVYVSIDEVILGYFELNHSYRKGLSDVLQSLGKKRKLSLLSGDNNSERKRLEGFFPKDTQMLFEMSPSEKMLYIHQLKESGDKVGMIGDGLNDAGALKVADIGISVTENTAHFSPGSDVIMDASVFHKLSRFFRYAQNTLNVIKTSFVISLIYNIVGLSFAIQGLLSPVMAAILMPISSISVIVFTTLSTYILARKNQIIE
ncbi:MAG: heavy metal translocating P-type ATPase metal-binding domain-containing protein [Bacteroidia bacterium]|nr:heavy metal translocating P-type ATPase metal-binding domain-containing protein [Bacteroidia bacterium]MCF8426774.1 heavy metal translocating P-type ATPase metal-binding domain-containing protein [Bacteroidia bacterium]MCF8445566.1 heavy metal translocating P-type ATPase metal-binding domain-containing protein [Bacteroidia bacterium]